MIAAILFNSWISGEAIRFFDYSGVQYGWLFLNGTLNVMMLNTMTIAMQNERSGFITMLGYLTLAYSCIGDIFIFSETFGWIEIAAITVILLVNITLICTKLNKERT